MPAFSFVDIPDADDFSPCPPGHYLARYEHKETTIEYGHEKWIYFMVIDNGPQAGRRIRDSITWIQRPANDKEMKAAQRTKLVLSRLGFDVECPDTLDYQPEHLKGLKSVIEVINKEQADPSTGAVKIFNNIPFAGYERPEVFAAKQAAAKQGGVAPAPPRAKTAAAPAQAPATAPVTPPAPRSPAPAAALSPARPPVGEIQPAEFSVEDLPF